MLSQRTVIVVDFFTTLMVTLVLRPLLLIIMNSFMLLQIRSGSECFVTFVTRIRFIACMNALVSDQVANLRERFAAPVEVTDVGLALFMHSFVFLHGRVLNECCLAVLAFKRSLSRVSPQMLPESLPAGEGFSTVLDWALVVTEGVVG